ncbi:hypothetical protein A1F94_008643 [Pyrenophora tritici-repentis]|nr:hypothetical protein A1F94_008643 [Pyrenophora tritici-repentis]
MYLVQFLRHDPALDIDTTLAHPYYHTSASCADIASKCWLVPPESLALNKHSTTKHISNALATRSTGSTQPLLPRVFCLVSARRRASSSRTSTGQRHDFSPDFLADLISHSTWDANCRHRAGYDASFPEATSLEPLPTLNPEAQCYDRWGSASRDTND